MSFNLAYAICNESRFIDGAEAIAHCVTQGRFRFGLPVCRYFSKQINDAFFGGAPLAPKKLADILSIDFPKCSSNVNWRREQSDCIPHLVAINRAWSFSAFLGFVEGIPLIGSALAVIKGLGHLYGMISSNVALKKAVQQFTETQYQGNVLNGASRSGTAKKVFDAAVSYTFHQNQLLGSLLSLIPLVKPIVRIAQVTLYKPKLNVQKEAV